MNKAFIILFVLLLVIAASGCTYEDKSPSKLKKYKGHGISFDYPPEYKIKETNNESGVILKGINMVYSDYSFEISKEFIDHGNEVSLEDMKDTERLRKSGFTVEEVQNITIMDTKGIDIIYARYEPPYVKYERMVFEKKNNRYTLLFIYRGVGVTDTRATTTILGSFRVN